MFVKEFKLVNIEMTKGILCTIDFTETSKSALRWSISLAESLNTHLTILYTYRLVANPANVEASELKKKIEQDAGHKFAELEKELLVGKKVDYEFKAEVGFVSNRVKDFVKKYGLSFLVVGDKMTNTNKELLDELVRDVQAPLVIIP